MIHLTFTGFHAGKTYCGAERTGSEAHGVYAPVSNADYRAKVCRHCLKVLAEGYENDDGVLDRSAPEWARKIMEESKS